MKPGYLNCIFFGWLLVINCATNSNNKTHHKNNERFEIVVDDNKIEFTVIQASITYGSSNITKARVTALIENILNYDILLDLNELTLFNESRGIDYGPATQFRILKYESEEESKSRVILKKKERKEILFLWNFKKIKNNFYHNQDKLLVIFDTNLIGFEYEKKASNSNLGAVVLLGYIIEVVIGILAAVFSILDLFV